MFSGGAVQGSLVVSSIHVCALQEATESSWSIANVLCGHHMALRGDTFNALKRTLRLYRDERILGVRDRFGLSGRCAKSKAIFETVA